MGGLQNFLSFARNYAGPKELAGRVIELLVGYLIYPVAFLFPRNSQKWVFGTNVGFTDNAKYLYLYALEQKEVHAIWITNKTKVLREMRDLHLEVYSKWSMRGLWHCLTAGRYIFTSHSNDINFFTVGRAKKVNLWHGVGIKGSGMGTQNKSGNAALKSFLFRLSAPHQFEQFDLFLSTGPLMNTHFSKMFGLKKGVLYEGMYPRCSFLMQPKENIENHIRQYESSELQKFVVDLKKYSCVYLYMPTWRADMKDDFIEQAGFDFEVLNRCMCEHNALFLMKLHPAVRHHADYCNYDAVRFIDSSIDIYPILPFTDVLITDYSSIYYDYLLMKDKDVLLFPFDYQDYMANSKGLAFDFDTYTPGVRVYTFEQLINLLSSHMNLSFPQREDILQLFWGKQYNCKKNIQILFEKIKTL